MTRTVFYTATTLDGFLADDHDSLAWLFTQDIDQAGPGGYEPFIAGVGALVMGATTYAWVRDQLRENGETWSYEQPCWVFTHRDLEPLAPEVRFVSGPVTDHAEEIRAAAGERDVWVVGGGDLAGQHADAGLLDQVVVAIAPVTLGAGRPLFPRRQELALVETARNGDFVTATYDVRGPLRD
ncbi:Dihydrofolate reductase [Nocardioides scoriae]|uniref:Dihydrofolate reductase n=1 Tax=Nocardioides scoriae TaxID=642780 RepID=A0A1H1SBY8_9ACTN|nr:dihydrofolate reductase family protein [Nocardioides scoriae]SDS45383.1 Dihydrofolate reductase [Nocardioides scoriae]